MRHLLSCIVPFAVLGLAVAGPPASDEPPLRLSLRIGEQTHALVDGKEATIEVAGKATKVTVSVDPLRRFDGAGVQFDYPRSMGFEFEEEAGLAGWTLDGNDTTVLVHQHQEGDAPAVARDTLTSVASSFDEAAKITPHELRLGGKPVAGFTVTAEIGGHAIRWFAVGLEVAGKTVVLTVQDSLRDGKQSAETTRMFELLATTFATAPPPALPK